ncbi:MAG: ACT domain-containing protein [Opitutaceae bacterium]
MNFDLRRQLTVALENEPGRLAAISRILAEAGHSIHGLCVIDNIEQGVVRMLVSDPGSCADLLNHHGFCVVESEVLAISVPNLKGVFARVTRVLAENRINVDYAYLTAGEGSDTSLMVMKVSDLVAAESVLVALNESGDGSPVI